MKISVWPFNLLSHLSFRKKMTISMIIISLLMILFMALSTYRLSSSIITDISKELAEKDFLFVYSSLDDYFANVENYSTLFLRSQNLRTVMQMQDPESGTGAKETQQLSASIREIVNLAASNDKITFNTVNFYCKNGFSYSFFEESDLPYNDYESCIKYYIDNHYLSESYNSSTWCDLIETTNLVGRKSMSFINLRILYDPATYEAIGIMVTGIDEENLQEIYSDFSDKAFILHKNGRIISHTEKSIQGSSIQGSPMYAKIIRSEKTMETFELEENEKIRLITFKKLAYNDTYFVVPFDYYGGTEILGTKTFRVTVLFLALICLAGSVFFAMLLSRGLSASVLSLKKTVQDVCEGDLHARFESKNSDEITYLGQAFNKMLDEVNSSFSKQKEQEKVSQTLELKLMQSQINPHLLYNTLDSALWKLENHNIAHAKNLLLTLSNFFKITLSGGNDLIPVQKELDLVCNYIEIQNTARGKEIDCRIETSLPTLDYKILKLTLQPIVENAILHGFSGFRDNGRIVIRIEKEAASENPSGKETLVFTVEDNGIGIPEDDLAGINRFLDTYPPESEIKHYGLFNVQRRIKNLFGCEFGIRLESEVGNYTRVIMRIPALML